jgi:hypothetical protein
MGSRFQHDGRNGTKEYSLGDAFRAVAPEVTSAFAAFR